MTKTPEAFEAEIGIMTRPGIDQTTETSYRIMIKQPPVVHYFDVIRGKEIPMELNVVTGKERERKFPQF